jgi:uncharacterized protein YjbI with pentapeptide repeats
MANKEYLVILKRGVREWNVWRRKHSQTRIDLRKADLRRADLKRADLTGADLRKADLTLADLTDAKLGGADLRGAGFDFANLDGADMRMAKLSKASFIDACLRNAKLGGADLRGASLYAADLSWTDFERANLTGADLTAAQFGGTDFDLDPFRDASLVGASLSRTDFSGMSLKCVDLTGVDFREARLIDTNLDGATLTDCWLWETQRAGWSIQDVICEAAYWDRDRQKRETYSVGEFERLYADKTKIVVHYDGGISPIEIATLPALIQCIEITHPGCILRLHSVQDAPGGATVTLIVEHGDRHNPNELEALKADIQTYQIALREERDIHKELRFELDIWYNKIVPRILGHTTVYGGLTVGDKYIAGQVGAQGPSAHAHDMTFNQLWSQSGHSIDLQALATELATLRRHLRQEAVEPEHDVAIGAIASAEVAAKEGNGPKTFEWLGKAGKWTLDNATKIGVGVATAALKTALGLSLQRHFI